MEIMNKIKRELRSIIRKILREVTEKIDATNSRLDRMEKIWEVTEKIDAANSRLDRMEGMLNHVWGLECQLSDRMRVTDWHLANWEENWQRERLYAFKPQEATDELKLKIERVKRCFPLMNIDPPPVRVGRDNDGGYVMVDDFSDCRIAYSFGISDDVSWDKDMAKRGLDVYMYDHTIEALPELDPKFHWQRIGIADRENPLHPELKTLPKLLEENGHAVERNMILKMDIEGMEWDVLSALDSGVLSRFSQIVLEMHCLYWKEPEAIEKATQNLGKTHALVHLHANNYSGYILHEGQCLPLTIECTYVLKEKYSVSTSTEFSPSSLDMKNYNDASEIMLGWWGQA